MFLTDDLLQIDEAESSQVWRVPVRQITVVEAEVSERWMVNARMHPSRFRELVPAQFLEPQLVDGSVVLALCAIRMRHAAPAWAPLALGPASMNCALRVGCRDSRDGRPCVWVTKRFTDSVLATTLAELGFPAVSGGLVDHGGVGRLDLSAGGGLVQVQAGPGHAPAPELFGSGEALDAFIAAGVRSYAPGRTPGHWSVIDLEKRAENNFIHCVGWEGWLRTPWGDCTIDGVYRTVDGFYRWSCHGEVDDHARPL